MSYGIVGLIVLILDIIAIVNIVQSGMTAAAKIVWVLIVLLLPVIGMILWFLIGSKRLWLNRDTAIIIKQGGIQSCDIVQLGNSCEGTASN